MERLSLAEIQIGWGAGANRSTCLYSQFPSVDPSRYSRGRKIYIEKTHSDVEGDGGISEKAALQRRGAGAGRKTKE